MVLVYSETSAGFIRLAFTLIVNRNINIAKKLGITIYTIIVIIENIKKSKIDRQNNNTFSFNRPELDTRQIDNHFSFSIYFC